MGASAGQRYRKLPTGSHGLDPEEVKRHQSERLRAAMVELIAEKGYPAVRIADLSRLAHVSPPTLYSLYANKEELFLGAYQDIAQRASAVVTQTGDGEDRLRRAMAAFAELAAAEPQAVSLLVLGALGAGPRALQRRRVTLGALESFVQLSRDPLVALDRSDLTVKALLGGLREVTAARLRDGRQDELPQLADSLASWALSYPHRLPEGLRPCAGRPRAIASSWQRSSLESTTTPNGDHGHRRAAVRHQQERIVDATAAIVAEKGLAGLTIPGIARRANVSNQTFYGLYSSTREAFLGAQKVGMHQALRVTARAYEAHASDWPRAVVAGIDSLLALLSAEPAHAHLTLVDTFAATPEAIAIRGASMEAFRSYLAPGFEHAEGELPPIVGEAVVGGVWQVLHHYIETERLAELPAIGPQLAYFALAPFLGPQRAAEAALT